jgi:hypothetical protein
MINLLAENIGDPFRGIGPLGLEGADDAGGAPGIFNKFISGVVGLLTIIAIIWFVFLLITGAYGFMTASGDKAQIETARKKIATAVVGLIIVIAAVFIVDLIGELIGIENILNPAELLKRILPY